MLAGGLALAIGPLLLLASAWEQNPSANYVLVGLWADLTTMLRAGAETARILGRAWVSGPWGPALVGWVLLAALACLAWLRLLALPRSPRATE